MGLIGFDPARLVPSPSAGLMIASIRFDSRFGWVIISELSDSFSNPDSLNIFWN